MGFAKNVLIFPAGSEIGLEIYGSLKYSHHVNVYGASGKNDHAAFIYPKDHYIEDEGLYVSHPGFIDLLNSYLVKYQISFVYPTHDTVANFLAEHQSYLAANIVTSCAETNYIARFKRETYKCFSEYDFCPAVYTSPLDILSFPVFLKPNDGQGGKGTFCVNDMRELNFYLHHSPDLLITEFLPGDELSVDCFTDFSGKLLFIGPRTRERVQIGISFRSTAISPDDEITRIAHAINNTLALNGAWFFQVKRDRYGHYKLLEFAPRQSSTMGLYRHAGVNFALLSYFNAQRIPVDILCNNYELQLDRCLHNRFKADFSFNRVYIDLDETIIIGNYVHDRVMAFLYQCRNKNIIIILLTKHQHDVASTLERCGIASSLFAEIIHLSGDQEKSSYINPQGSIFIDNYWFDRRDVKERLGIPVFDVDAVECLLQ